MSDITLAASESAFEQLFKAVRDNFTFSKSDSDSFGPFSASYSVALHLEGGTIQFMDDNTIEIKIVDIVFDTLELEICFELIDIPCIPSFCIVPDPWNGCLVGFPGFCLPSAICAPLNLSGLVSEINMIKAGLKPQYFIDPDRLAGWSDLDAEFNGKPNKWRIFIDPDWVSVDPIDVPATVGNMLENAVEDAIDALFPDWLPDWATNWILSLLGPILDLVIEILGIVDNVEDFIQDLLGNMFDLLGFIETAVADYFANQYPIYQFEDPYPILESSGGLIPVKIPLRDLKATVNSEEMVIQADVG